MEDEQLAADFDREATVRALGGHYASGRLSTDEYMRRTDAAYQAERLSELRRLTRDLPAADEGLLTRLAGDRAWRAHASLWLFVAAELGISERTARTHVSNILRKLGVSSRTEAALLVVRGRSEATS